MKKFLNNLNLLANELLFYVVVILFLILTAIPYLFVCLAKWRNPFNEKNYGEFIDSLSGYDGYDDDDY